MTENARTLTITTGTSRGAETYGYTIVRLRDEQTGKRFRCMGGGYDMVGTVFGEWLEETFQDRLQAIGSRAYTLVNSGRRDNSDPGALYGMTYYREESRVRLDGACGLESMRRIAEAVGLKVRAHYSPRGGTRSFTVTDERA